MNSCCKGSSGGSYTLAYICYNCASCTTPGTPVSATGTATSETTADLSWSAGSPVGSPTVTYYWVVGTSPSVTYGNGVAQGTTTSTTASATGLSCNTTYYLRVYASTSCDGSYSGYATSLSFSTPVMSAPVTTATPAYVCAGGTSDLAAVSAGNMINWYDAPSGGNLLGTTQSGASFPVVVPSTTTYYAEAFSAGNTFYVTSMTANNSYVTDHSSYSGDDRSGIAITQSYYYYVGDSYTVRYDMPGLSNPTSLTRRDGIFSDLSGSGTLYTLWDGSSDPNWPGSYTVTSVRTLNSDCSLGGTVIPLSTNITMNATAGIYSGVGCVILETGYNFYKVDLPSGTVTNLGYYPYTRYPPENWAVWGIAEYNGTNYSILYRDGNGQYISRLNLSTGAITTLANFSSLSDMCCIAYSPWHNRWYFHHEGGSQFGGSSETAGYADGTHALVLGSCISARQAVTVTVGTPAIPSSVTATPSTINCGETSDLSAVSANATINWYDAPSGGNLLGTSLSGASFQVTPAVTTTYYAEGYTTCASLGRTAVTVTVNSLASPTATATPSTVSCGTSANLSGTGAGSSINWYDSLSGGNLLGTTNNGANFPVTPNVTTTYYAEAVTGSGSGSQSFTYTGNVQYFTVPTGVTSITVDASGAGGGITTGSGLSAGNGGRIIATVPVTPGETLKVIVGGYGSNATDNRAGSGGGGFSGLLDNSNNHIVTAGGGGGSAGNEGCSAGSGGNGGAVAGTNGSCGTGGSAGISGGAPSGGSGGTGSYPGSSGTASGGGNGGATSGDAGTGGGGGGWGTSAGLSMYGGCGGYSGAGGFGGGGSGGTGGCGGTQERLSGGGGGGGGYAGGGGGNNTPGCGSCGGGGGGGGSNYAIPAATAVSSTVGGGASSGQNGQVLISWSMVTCYSLVRTPVTVYVIPLPAPTVVTATPDTLCVGSGDSTYLNATYAGASINWYDAPSGGNLIGTSLSGNNFPIAPSVTTTYYAEAVVGGGSGSQTFTYTGNVQNFTVPSGITSITVDASGAGGGVTWGTGLTAGSGGRIVATVSVSPGQNLRVIVGGYGEDALDNNRAGSGGGGFSGVLDNSDNHLVTAGGGGGSAGNEGCVAGNGGDGGALAGTNGGCGTGGAAGVSGPTPSGGAGGTGSYPGNQGTASGGGDGGATSGDAGTGGGGGGWGTSGGLSLYGGCGGYSGAGGFGGGGSGGTGGCGSVQERLSGGGGGGGGYAGGGGGNSTPGCGSCGAGGGGGGSNYAAPGATGITSTIGGGASAGQNGQVTISWSSVNCLSLRTPVTVTLLNPPSAVSAAATPNPVCNGSSLQLTGSATDATNWTWSGPDAYVSTLQSPLISTVSQASEGAYVLTASNLCGSTMVFSPLVYVTDVPNNVTANATPNPVCEGSTLVLAGNANNATSYGWSGPNGFTSTSILVSRPGIQLADSGIYTFTATNACGNTVVNTTTVNVTPLPSVISLTATPNPVCENDTLYLNAQASNISYYDWSGPGGFTASGQNVIVYPVQMNNAGPYTLIASNACGSITSVTPYVTVNPLPTGITAIASPNPVCENASLNLYGTGQYVSNWNWSGPNGFTSIQQNPVISAIPLAGSGTYTLTASNACGSVSATSSSVIVDSLSNPGSIAVSNSPVCINSGVTLNLTGYTGNILYWEQNVNGGGWTNIGNAGSASVILSSLNTAGVWEFRAIVGYGTCAPATSAYASVQVDAATLGGAASPALDSLCVDGSSQITLSGQTGNVLYWEQDVNGGGWINIGNAGMTSIGTGVLGTAGVWSFHPVVQSGVCPSTTGTASVLTVVPDPILSGPSDDTICAGTSANLSVSVSGGAGTANYQWQYSTSGCSGPWVNIGGNSATLNTGALYSDTWYQCLVGQSASGCYAVSACAMITVNHAAQITSISSDSTICEFSSVSFGVTASGIPTPTYQWYGPAGMISGADQPVYQIAVAGMGDAGDYYCVVSNNCGSSTSNPINLTVIPTVGTPIGILGATSRCQGQGSDQYTTSAPNATSYNWSLSNAGASTIDPQTGLVSWDAAFSGTATVSVTANGCNGPSQAITLNVVVTPTVGQPTAIQGTILRCQGSGTDVYTTTATDNTGFNWSIANAGASVIDPSTGTVSWDAAFYGTATISVTANGCNGPSQSVSLDVDVIPTVGTPVAITGTTLRCQNYGTDQYSSSAPNSTGLNWSLIPPAAGSIDPQTGLVSWDSLFTGIATVMVSANGCNGPSATVSLDVTVVPSVIQPVFLLGAGSVICQGSLSTQYIAFSQNTTSFYYTLSNAGGSMIDSLTGWVIWDPAFYGIATVTAHAEGCNGPLTTDHLVTVNPKPVAGFTAQNACAGNVVSFTNTSTISSGTMTYLWDFGDGNTSNLVSPTHIYATSLTYSPTLTVTSDLHCTDQFTMPLTIYPLPVINPITQNITCNGNGDGSILVQTSSGTQPYQYSLNGGTWQSDSLYNNLQPGSYLIEVSDSHGCATQTMVNLTEPLLLVSYYSVTEISCNAYGDGSVDLSVSGGTAPYTYVWSNGPQTEDLSGLTVGYYSVTVTDAQGCSTTNSAYVSEPSPVEVTSQVVNATCISLSDGSISLTADGGVSPYTFLWNTGAYGDLLEGLAGGNYSVVVTDANGCSQTLSYFVDMGIGNCLNIPTSFTPNGDGKNDTWIIRNISVYQECVVQIYNRWGNLLYESKGYTEPWDGKYKGKELPPETYYYVIRLTPDTEALTGTVTIVK